MIKMSVRLDAGLHERLTRRAVGADLSLSVFVRQVLEQAADPNDRYVYSSQDEILATCIQILALLTTSLRRQSPDALKQGMADARAMLRSRGLLDPELDQ